MTTPEIDQILRSTLGDMRLSGGERRALGEVLADVAPDAQQLAFLRHRAFALAREQVLAPDARQALDWLEEVIKVLQAQALPVTDPVVTEAHFSPGSDCPRTIAGLFARARKTADVCVFTITDDRISTALLDAHRRGVAVRLITDNDKALDLGSDIEAFRQAGVPLRLDRTMYHMHHKFALFDGALLLTGSYNWTRGAAEQNLENFIVTGDRSLVAAFSRTFARLWETF
jgi:cardiolipin hydrolase